MLTSHYPGRPNDVWPLLGYNGINGLAHRNSARAATAARFEEEPAWRLLRKVSEEFRSQAQGDDRTGNPSTMNNVARASVNPVSARRYDCDLLQF